MEEVAPHVYRVQFAVDKKPMAMYLVGSERLMLIDSGLTDTPSTIYRPAISALGRTDDDVSVAVITHADADHIGGNAQVHQLFPHALLACHQADKAWIEDPAAIMAERYDGFARYGLRYDQAVFDMLGSWMGPATPADILLTGGERFRVHGDDWLKVLHLPGHTPGHIGLYNQQECYAIVGDALFGLSQLDTDGQWSAPPPYQSVTWYVQTLETLQQMNLDLLLTCHYPVMRGEEITVFIEQSFTFVEKAQAFVKKLLDTANEPVSLAAAIDQADRELGPFGFARDLQFPLLAHFEHEVALGTAQPVLIDGNTMWTRIGV